MPKVYADADSVAELATRLIPMNHPELATARIKYVFVDVASMKNGRPVLGKAAKISGINEYLIGADFLLLVAMDQWNEQTDVQRSALVDHLLERCTGEEQEDTGEMSWTMREPDVQEFASILRRHGAWNDNLTAFTSVAQQINVQEMVDEVEEVAQTEA